MTQPSSRKLAGLALILLLIVLWAAFVASLAPFVGRWPVLVQAPYYLVMGIAWIIPLKPLIRWTETGSFRYRSAAQRIEITVLGGYITIRMPQALTLSRPLDGLRRSAAQLKLRARAACARAYPRETIGVGLLGFAAAAAALAAAAQSTPDLAARRRRRRAAGAAAASDPPARARAGGAGQRRHPA